ncbi:nuclear transport factor 2 family protein [Streptomyces sp. enrichment culture]|uniref:nuclear transport factor 2 family protein n=1 Tax=Streptomyces sp. enrichment culture TaxID=1795815 RepID=UPI003F5766D1
MTTAPDTTAPDPARAAERHRSLLDFYARQMHAADADDADAYARTFTEDTLFVSNALPAPVRGRETVRESTRRFGAARAARGVVRRHLLTSMTVDDLPDGALATRSYVLLVETPRGGGPQAYLSTVCADEVIAGDDGWQVRRRTVQRDDLPPLG